MSSSIISMISVSSTKKDLNIFVSSSLHSDWNSLMFELQSFKQSNLDSPSLPFSIVDLSNNQQVYSIKWSASLSDREALKFICFSLAFLLIDGISCRSECRLDRMLTGLNADWTEF